MKIVVFALLFIVLSVGAIAQGLVFEGEHANNGQEEEGETPRDEASGNCGDYLEWKYDRSTFTLTISGEGDMSCFNSSFPWSHLAKQVNHVKIEEGVSSIERDAFCEFARMKTVTLPSTLESIGINAFSNCVNLTSIILPSSLISIIRFATVRFNS